MKKYVFILYLCLSGNLSFSQQTIGLFLNDSLAFNGYTLFAPASSTTTYLVDNCGNVINTWESPFRPGEVAYLLENGNLLRACRLGSSHFFGGGIGGRLEMYNWEGELVWGYDYRSDAYHQHHDLEYLPSGNILLTAWEYRTEEEAIQAGRNPSKVSDALWPTQVIELQPIGTNEANIVWEWHLWDHLIQDFDPSKNNYGTVADHPELVDINSGQTSSMDWAHVNSVDYNPALDQIIITSRYFSEFWIIDHSTTSEEAAGHTGGNSGRGGDILYRWGNPYIYRRGTPADQSLFGPHDVHWIPEGLPDAGKIMIFNNGQGRPTGAYSSVDIITPPMDANGNYMINNGTAYGPNAPDWSYTADPPNSFFSGFISGAQRLPNGNTLICEGARGHFFEVDTEGNKHWEYISPVAFGGPLAQGEPIGGQNTVFRAYRYATNYPAFDDRELTPGTPVELNPIASDCQIYETIISTENPENQSAISSYPNPVSTYMNVHNRETSDTQITIFDLAGKALYTQQYDDASFEIDMQFLQSGIYFIHFYNENNLRTSVVKVVKM